MCVVSSVSEVSGEAHSLWDLRGRVEAGRSWEKTQETVGESKKESPT